MSVIHLYSLNNVSYNQISNTCCNYVTDWFIMLIIESKQKDCNLNKKDVYHIYEIRKRQQ